jgi:hypothetical protein
MNRPSRHSHGSARAFSSWSSWPSCSSWFKRAGRPAIPQGSALPAKQGIGTWLQLGSAALRLGLAWFGAAPIEAAETSPPAIPAAQKAPVTNSTHWSFQPLRSSSELLAQLPPGSADSASRLNSPIDRFIRARLDSRGLAGSPEADRSTLIRRLSFDLLGLPPSPDEIDAFVQDPSPRAWENLVDRLLASPRYGERWATALAGRGALHGEPGVRVRPASGIACVALPRLRDPAASTTTSPTTVFMREQIAGDVLQPVTRERMVATGLLVAGPWDQAGNSQANATQRAITREEEMEDLVSVVGQTFLGLTVNCARCHDHKFDPIPLSDYYRVKAVFDGVKHGDRSIEGEAEAKAREARLGKAREEVARWEKAVSALEQTGASRVMARISDAPREAGPTAFERWAFDGAGGAMPSGEAKGGAVVGPSGLQLPKAGAYFEAAPLTREIREKTLEAWVSLSDLEQGGGAAISLESRDGGTFDAIVFGERQGRKWMAGSEGFVRTKDVDGPAEESTPDPTAWVSMSCMVLWLGQPGRPSTATASRTASAVHGVVAAAARSGPARRGWS